MRQDVTLHLHNGATTFRVTALSIKTLSIKTFSIIGLFATLSINDIQNNVFGVIMLSVVMMSVAISLMLC
jgi:hypothetical protein